MQLRELIRGLGGEGDAPIVGDGAVEITSVTADSRAVGSGSLFVAVRGITVDGHDFIDKAIEAGAAAVVVEAQHDSLAVPQVVVPRTALALGPLVARLSGDPQAQLRMVGITGTNGKTTTTYLVEAIVRAAGREPGVLGTVSYRFGGAEHPAPYTTPTPDVLYGALADMAAAGVDDAVLEVSSAALDMGRLSGCQFAVAAFTNLTQDHLDLHGTMDAYQGAKALLFSSHLSPDGIAVINIDDDFGEHMAQAAGGHRVLRVSASGNTAADVRAVNATSTIDGIRADIETPSGTVTVGSRELLGSYNVHNLAMAVAIADAMGIEHDAIERGIATMRGVPGRVERVDNSAGLDILVDYAHTPAALRNVLAALRPLCRGRLLCVFGCGGDRDPSKREPMGRAVSELADLPFVTSDNPRTEDPQAIVDMIVPAVANAFYVGVDRAVAIEAAVAEAAPGDIVLIAGKGHEDYQILGTEKIHFDDREVAAAAIEHRANFTGADIVAATGATAHALSTADFSRVIIDGRSAARGDLYVAIVGERFDGHDFCAQAVAAGASGLMVSRGRGADVAATLSPDAEVTIFEVDDPRKALGDIARLHRRRMSAKVIAVTGSAGKTTTKDLIAAALSASHVHATKRSLNNETGVPLTLLGIRRFHDYAVVEMGMRGLGQITYLTDFAEPDVGVVINAGVAHVGVVGSVDAIVQGKSEMFAGVRDGGTAIYPADDARLAARATAAPRAISYGDGEDADVRMTEYQPIGGRGCQVTIDGGDPIELPLFGRHNALNATCAFAAAVAAGADPGAVRAGLSRATPPALRGQLETIGGRHYLIDCYNSNPAALDAALTTLVELAAGADAVALIGDMLELGDDAAEAHRKAGERAAALGVAVIAVGELATDVARGAADAGGTAEVAADAQTAAAAIANTTPVGAFVLVKASRGVKLENAVAAVRELSRG